MLCNFQIHFLQGVLFIAILSIAFVLVRKSHSANNKWVPWCFGLVWLLGTYLYGYIYVNLGSEAATGWLSLLVISAVSSAQMFIGGTHFFDNGFHEFFFGEGGIIPLVLLSFLTIIALFLSAYVLFNMIIKRLSSKSRLKGLPDNNQEVHVFFGNNTQSQLLAKDIKDIRSDAQIIIIEYPDDNNRKADDNSLISGLFRMLSADNVNNSFIYLQSATRLTEPHNTTRLEMRLDIQGLDKWIFRNNTSLYFLSDDETDNKESLKILKQCVESNYLSGECRVGCVYCHAKKDELSVNEEDYYRQRFNVVFIDSSSLSIRQLLKEDKLSLPVHFVDIPELTHVAYEGALSEDYKPGYVKSEFNSAIFGFGELGHEAFNFLYEYGAFPGKRDVEGKITENPWKVYVFDKHVNERAFKSRYPGFDMSKIIFDKMNVEEDSNWDAFKHLAPEMNLNYIFICTGDDSRNLRTLSKIDECLDGVNVQKLRIMVKYSKSELESIFFNQFKNIGGSVHLFGIEKKIWRFNIISDELFVKKAIQFSTSYLMCADKSKLDSIIEKDENLSKLKLVNSNAAFIKAGEKFWENREDEIARPTNTTDRPKLLRKKSQDMANAWHCYTKEQLVGQKYLYKYAEQLSNLIPLEYSYDSSDRHGHAPAAKDFELDILENLAVCEHIRWNASHIVRGYKLGEHTNDSQKTHNCIKNYYELSEQVQHYDWLVVKNTLLMFAESFSKHTDA